MANDTPRTSKEPGQVPEQGISGYAVFMLDPAGIVTSWNPGVERIEGYKGEEIVGRHVSQFYAADDVERGKPARDLEIAAREGCFEEEGLRVRKDGSRFWARVIITPVYDRAAQLIGFVKVAQDIIKRKERAKSLEDSARFNRAALDGLSARIAILDDRGTITMVNEAWEKFGAASGLAAGHGSLGDNYLTVCDRDSGPFSLQGAEAAAGIRAVLAGEVRQFALDYPCHTASEPRWFTVRVTLFPGEGRRRVIVAHEDITERMVAEAARRRADEQLAFVLQRSGVGSFEVDLVDHTGFRTLEHARIFGDDPSQSGWSPERFLERVHPEDRAEVERLVRQVIAAKPDLSFECRIRRADGEVRWIWVTATSTVDIDGRARRIAGIVRDITERRLSEQALRESEETLRLFVEHAPAAIAMFDRQMRYLAVSHRWLADFGIDPSRSLIGRSHYDVFPDLPERWKLAHRRGLEGEVVSAEEDYFVFGTHEGWIRWEVRPWHDGDGGVGGIILCIENITERKLAGDALRERERLLRIVTASARVGLVVVEAGYRYVFANEAYAEIFGLSTSDIVGRRVPDILAEGWPQIQPRLDRALGGERVSYELTLPPPKGSQETRHYAVVYEPRIGDDRARSVVVVVLDITQRKRVEEALQGSEERLRLMIEAVSDHAIFMLDSSGNILTWNRGAEQIDGYTAEEIIGRHYSCLFTAEGIASGLPQRELELAALEGRASIEGWRVRKNGARFWANGTLAAFYDSTRRVKGFSKITRDLTAKRRNDELLRSVLNHTVDAIVSTDAQGTVSMINHAGERLFGRAAPEVVGQSVSLLMPEAFQHEHADCLASDARTGEAKAVGIGREVRGLRKDGTAFPLELAVAEFSLDDQRHYVWILRDVSEKKALEAQFRQSQKMEAFGQLAGGVAHDFNNLLAVIMGNLELLRSGSVAPAELDLIDRALHAATRGAELTHRLLAYARKQELDPKRVNLNSFVRHLVGLFHRTIGEDIEIVTRLAPDVDGVDVDAGQLENALLNLAVNARDAMPEGGTLTIATSAIRLDRDYANQHPGVAPGEYEAISVTDTGRGMTKEVLARAFDPFFTTKDVGKGTGLGLSMVYGFAKQSGGHATIYSEVDQGTTVSLYLPRAAGPAAVSTAKAAQEPRRLGSGQHVLLVEDDPAVRSMVERQLSALGYRMTTAANGREALERLPLISDIDLLLTDVVMPGGMSGVDLAAAARQVRPGLHVLFMSGYPDGGNAGARIRAEGMHCLGKPFTRSQLADAMGRALEAGKD